MTIIIFMGAFKSFIVAKQSSVGSAAFILMVAVGMSRILGLIRDRMLAGYFSTEELGIYFAAFRLPNMLFELLVMGALTTAFIPVFTKLLTKKSEEDAWKMASVVMNYGLLLLAIVMVPLWIFAHQISQFLAPGFTNEQITEMTLYTRYMLVFQVFPLMIGNFLTGMLQSYQIFFIPALAPILYNVGIIIGIFTLSTFVGLFAPVYGVIIGAVLFFAIQIIPVLLLRYRYTWSLDTKTEGVKEVGRLMLPRTIGVGVGQIDTTVDLMLASLLGSKMVTVFQFAQHLQNLPIGLFGATIAQAALPSLSRSTAKEETTSFKDQIISGIHQILFFIVPVSVFFIVLRIPITRLVFGSDQFDWESTVLTGKTLSFFSISLFAQGLIHLLARGFYALYDTKTPVYVGIASILVNAFFSILFISIFHFPVWSLGLSTSIASIFQAGLLLVILQRKIGWFSFREIFFTPLKIVSAAGIMGLLLFGLLRLLDQLVFDTTRTINLFFLTVTVGLIGLGVYLFIAWVFGVGQVDAFLRLLKRIDKIRSKYIPWTYPLLPDQEQKQL